MTTKISPLAGQPATVAPLVDLGALLEAYTRVVPDAAVASQRVAFGTSGHRGTSLDGSFNEAHVLAISQAIGEHRRAQGIEGPLFIGADTHALSAPALTTAVEVLVANGVVVKVSAGDEPVPTPAVSHAILAYNRGRAADDSGRADGIVVTPSHNPPDSGGFKYNPPNGGPADTAITAGIEARANELLAGRMGEVKRTARPTAERHDFAEEYVGALRLVIDFEVIRGAKIKLGVDPLGGAGVHYWARIAEREKIDLSVVSTEVDPRFAFMSLDWDGKVRMDPSSSWAMQRLIGLRDSYDVAFGCDTDHDRHGIVTRTAGLMPPNHYLAVMVDYLFRQRAWRADAGVGKTLVSSAMIDRVAARLGRRLVEVPVGFKWFVDGLFAGTLGFGGEESAGASFLRRDGGVWTTDKDGIAAALLAGEIMARVGKDPGEVYRGLAAALGDPVADRVDAPATPEQKRRLGKLSAASVKVDLLAGEKVESVLDRAPGNGAGIGGVKVSTRNGWFAARPSGTENIYKIYAESFLGKDHLEALLREAQRLVDGVIG